MNFLSRRAQPAEICPPDEGQRVVQREIEITVERNWTSVTVGVPGELVSSVCVACGQPLPCASVPHNTDATPNPFALEDKHAEPNR